MSKSENIKSSIQAIDAKISHLLHRRDELEAQLAKMTSQKQVPDPSESLKLGRFNFFGTKDACEEQHKAVCPFDVLRIVQSCDPGIKITASMIANAFAKAIQSNPGVEFEVNIVGFDSKTQANLRQVLTEKANQLKFKDFRFKETA